MKKTSTFLQATRQLAVLADLNEKSSLDAIYNLERAMAVSRHHYAVSGTEKQHVANDYTKRLSIGVEKAFNDVIKPVFNYKIESNFI